MTLVGALAVLGILAAGVVAATRAGPDGNPAARPRPPTGDAGGAVLAYLSGAAKGRTISGQHNREPSEQPAKWTEKVHEITGKYPGLWGGDLSFHTLAARPALIAEARGGDYVDVLSLDIWQKDHPARDDYVTMRRVAAGKPIALGEVKKVPSPEILEQQPDWAWFMVWAEELVNSNSEDAVKATDYDRRVLNRDQVSLGRPHRPGN